MESPTLHVKDLARFLQCLCWSLLEGALQPIIISFEKGGCFKKHEEWALCFSKHMLFILVYLSCDTNAYHGGKMCKKSEVVRSLCIVNNLVVAFNGSWPSLYESPQPHALPTT